jgi:ABC-type transport system substrate-binding protein
MQDRTLVLTALLASLILLSISVSPSIAFVYPDGSEDNKFEPFGPRVDKVVIKKYPSLDAELQALQNGEIDITDMGLNKTWIDALKSDPNITMLAHGGEPGYYAINFNNNDNEYLGNPEDPLYPNPVYPNAMSDPAIRQACSYFINRTALCSGQNEGLYEPIFTPIPAYMKCWIHPEIRPGGVLENLTYPANITRAAEVLDNSGFPVGPDGFRYWDSNTNGVHDVGEDLNIIVYSRVDALRKDAAEMLCAGLNDTAIKINYTRIECTGGVAWQKCMIEKDYHIYTSGWIFIGPNPDYLYDLYHWNSYYHPEDPPNFGAISKNDPVMQECLEEAKFAATSEDALAAVLAFQERFAEFACECPLGSRSSPKVFSKSYTGGNDGILTTPDDGENKYRGQAWTQVVSEAGQGEDGEYTMLNAYPDGFEYGDGNMTMRYGWSDNTQPKTLNPLYSSWYWEGQVLNLIYQGLFERSPCTQGPATSYSLLQNWTLGTWNDPRNRLNYSKVTITVRPDIAWSDGVSLTIDDVIYSLIQMPNELVAKGMPSPVWCCTFDYVETYRKLDNYSAEFLMNIKTYLAPSMVFGSWGWFLSSSTILPKHIWQPYIATHTPSQIAGDMSNHPEMLVGTGPFVFVENTADTLTLVKNPYFYQRMSTAVMRFDEQGYRHGVAVTTLTPSTQITPFKIQVDSNSLGHACITVPIENLDVDDECFIHERIELVYPNTTIVVLKDEASVNIQAAQMLLDNFSPLDFDRGKYTVKVTIEIIDGLLYDWVTTVLPSELWPSILGPKTIEQSFWVTTKGDIDSNCIVDIFDIVVVATVFGSTIGYPNNFNGNADLNGDCVVDIFDIVIVALSFGWG